MAMPNTSGRDIALLRTPATGAFDTFNWDSTGNPTFDDTDSHLVLSLLCEYQGGYWADTTGKRGSTLHLITLDVTGTAQKLVEAVNNALAPAIQDGRLRSATATATRVRPGTYELLVRYQNRQGQTQTTRVPIGS